MSFLNPLLKCLTVKYFCLHKTFGTYARFGEAVGLVVNTISYQLENEKKTRVLNLK